MKRLFVMFLFLLLVCGCSNVPTSTNVTAKHTITQVANATGRLQLIGALSNVVDKSLTANDVPTAQQLNNKITLAADSPTLAETKLVEESIYNKEAAKALEERINSLITEKRVIAANSNTLILAQETRLNALAQENRSNAEALDQLRNPFFAVWYGVSTLIKRAMWTLIGVGGAFLLLRIFATSSPILGAVFDVVQHAVAFIIKGVAALFPKAIAFGSSVFQQNEDTLSVLVDTIQSMRTDQTISELKDQLSKDTDASHRENILDIKKKLRWK